MPHTAHIRPRGYIGPDPATPVRRPFGENPALARNHVPENRIFSERKSVVNGYILGTARFLNVPDPFGSVVFLM